VNFSGYGDQDVVNPYGIAVMDTAAYDGMPYPRLRRRPPRRPDRWCTRRATWAPSPRRSAARSWRTPSSPAGRRTPADGDHRRYGHLVGGGDAAGVTVSADLNHSVVTDPTAPTSFPASCQQLQSRLRTDTRSARSRSS
jgi:hypothetical protein